MNAVRHFVLLAVLLSLATTGCSWFKRKKQPATVPQAQAPTVTEPKPAEPLPATASQAPPAEEPKPAETAAAAKPKPKPRPAHPVKKVVVPPPKPEEETTAAAAPPPRVTVQESAPAGNQISSAMPHDEATDSKRTTLQLLEATDTNLRNLKRSLSRDEKAMVEQIRAYQQQARTADQQGDVVRAHNLALKAHLLSDELVKR
ncbi:MAG TPA: hypothetical protein VLA96_11465 [Terriglobales bacterium]|jgi:outer membrane biosynthesis protein TonB|nr:hypothetical protein [Terriglobales bacterium]